MKCLTPECIEEQIFCRGLCKRCYWRAEAKVRRGTLQWGTLVDQGVAKRVSRIGASTEARRRGQLSRVRGPKLGCIKGCALSPTEYKIFIMQYKRGYKVTPGDMTAEQLKQYEELLGLSGPNDPILAGDTQ